MKQYLDLLDDIRTHGVRRHNRTGIDTLSVFGRQMHLDLNKGFPLLTTKKMFWKGVIGELLWFLRGDTNTKFLKDNGINIWNYWDKNGGDVGPMYGKQMRKWEAADYDKPICEEWAAGDGTMHYGFERLSIDQIANVIHLIKTDPNSRRICMTTWNPADLPKMALAPCHGVFTQFMVHDGELSCCTTQRSADCFLGVPFNIASYALLTHMIAQVCDLEVGELVYSFNDLHLYWNHLDQVVEQSNRNPYPLPKLELNPSIKNIDDFKFEDIKLFGYESHPAIKGGVAV